MHTVAFCNCFVKLFFFLVLQCIEGWKAECGCTVAKIPCASIWTMHSFIMLHCNVCILVPRAYDSISSVRSDVNTLELTLFSRPLFYMLIFMSIALIMQCIRVSLETSSNETFSFFLFLPHSFIQSHFSLCL